MALFGRKKEKQLTKEDFTISFEGEVAAITAQYTVSYEDVLMGLEIMAENQNKWRIWGGIAILIVCGVLATPMIFARSLVLGIVFLLFMAYIVFSQIFGPAMSRRHTAKKIAGEAKPGTLRLFAGGFQIEDESGKFDIPFRLILCHETKDSYVFMLGKAKMMVFNKSIFMDKNPLVKEILIANLGQGRRYIVSDK